MAGQYESVPTELDTLSSAIKTNEYGKNNTKLPLSILPPHLSTSSLASALHHCNGSDASLDSASSHEDDFDEKQAVDEEMHYLSQTFQPSSSKFIWLKRRSYLAPLAALLAVILVLVLFLAGHHSVASRNVYAGRGGSVPISMDMVFNGTLAYNSHSVHWVSDSIYASRDSQGNVALTDVAQDSNRKQILVDGAALHGLEYTDYQVSPDQAYVLLATRQVKHWRHSSMSTFVVYETQTKRTRQLAEDAAVAVWAPEGHALVYVKGNDVYVKTQPMEDGEGLRVTSSGSETIFNGVPDWVYQEEVFKSDSAIWWAPDGSKFAFASFDETDVPDYSFPVYNADPFFAGKEGAYPDELTMKYPKPGYPNPLATLYIFDLSSPSLAPTQAGFKEHLNEPILADVAWVSASELLVKRTDRLSTVMEEIYFDYTQGVSSEVEGRTVRQTNFNVGSHGGWYEPTHTIVPFAAYNNEDAELPSGYVDLIMTIEGFVHIAYFEHASDSRSLWLTSGAWEVESIAGVDIAQRRIWFIAAQPSTQRRLMWVPFPEKGRESEVVEPEEPMPEISFARADFSPRGGYMFVTSLGEKVPWQKLVSTKDVGDVVRSEENQGLADRMKTLQMPTHNVKTINVGGNDANVVEVLPPNFDHSGRTKYPVLVRCYGGPGSVMATEAYQNEYWHDFLASSHQYIVLTVDGRGTGFRGRDYRSGVYGQLGKLEAEDQIAVARNYSGQPFVDEKRMGIWGWSYGGFLTAKVVEAASGVFSLGMSVAPVTDWRFYDSIYTERYMGALRKNDKAYHESAISDMKGFHNTSFLLQAGSGDDNVHFLNSAALLDRLTADQVRNFRFRMYTDSDHSIRTRGARRELYEEMTSFLVEHWGATRSKANID